MKPETSPTKNGPESADGGNIVLKQREDSKRSESPAVNKVVPRRDSVRLELGICTQTNSYPLIK